MMRRLPVLLFCAATFSAHAAGAGALADPSASQRAPGQAEQAIGAALGVGPGYLGADNTMLGAGLWLEANFGNGVFLSSGDGIGFRLPAQSGGLSFAASLGASAARDESAGRDGARNRLRGMGDVHSKGVANLFLNYDGGPYHGGLAVRQTLAERRGTQVDVLGKYDLLATPADLVQASAGFTYANGALTRTYFGVSAAQAAASGHAAYAPAGGVAGAGAGLLWRHAYSPAWVGTLGAQVTALRGAAADSPLTARRAGAALWTSLGYRF